MTMIEAKPLVDNVREFFKITEMAQSTFGRYGMADSGFVDRIESASKVRFDTAFKARAFMVRVLDDAKMPKAKTFAAKMQQWIEDNPKPKAKKVSKAKPAPKPKPFGASKPVATPYRPVEETIAKLGKLAASSPKAAFAIGVQSKLQEVVAQPKVDIPSMPNGCRKVGDYSESLATKKLNEAKERTAGLKPIAGASFGAQMQEHALSEDIRDAVNVLKRKWPKLWHKICSEAASKNERPIPFMVSMLEAQVGKVAA
jgi:hypothetical protein